MRKYKAISKKMFHVIINILRKNGSMTALQISQHMKMTCRSCGVSAKRVSLIIKSHGNGIIKHVEMNNGTFIYYIDNRDKPKETRRSKHNSISESVFYMQKWYDNPSRVFEEQRWPE